jgi:hypothetical protein
MPIFPTYNATQNIKANVAAPARDEAAIPFENQQKIIAAAQKVTQAWSDAQDVMQLTQAKADTTLAIMQQKKAALDDPDRNNAAAHLKSLEKIKSNVVGNISNKLVAQKAEIEIGNDLAIAGMEIDNVFKKKQIDYTRAVDIPNVINGFTDKKINSERGSAVYQDAEYGLHSAVQSWVDNNIITNVEAQKLLSEERKSVISAYFAVDPEGTVERLENKKEFVELTPDERSELLVAGRREVRIAQAQRKENYEITQYVANNRILEGTMTVEEIDGLVALNKADPEQGIPEPRGMLLKAKLNAQISQDVTALGSRAKKYVKAANMVFTNDADRMKAYDAIIDAFDSKEQADELKFLNELIKTADRKKEATVGWNFLKSWLGFKKPDIEKEAAAMSAFVNKIRIGTHPQLAVQEVAYEQEVIDHPALAVNPDAITHIYNPQTGVTPVTATKPGAKK